MTEVPLTAPAMAVDELLDLADVEKLGIAWIGREQIIVDRTAGLRLKPGSNRRVEEADLGLVDDLVGHDPPCGLLEDVLRVQAPNLEPSGNRRAELDDLVIEE